MKVERTLADSGKKRYARPEFRVFRWVREALSALMERVVPASWRGVSKAKTEDLAREIVEYGQMHAAGAEVVVIEVGEVAFRLRESAHDVRQSLRLLEIDGMAVRTNSKDHWKLTKKKMTGKLTA